MLFPVSLLQAQKIAQHDALTVEELQADLDVFLDVYDHHPGLHLYHTPGGNRFCESCLAAPHSEWDINRSILYRIAAGTDLSGRRAQASHPVLCTVKRSPR